MIFKGRARYEHPGQQLRKIADDDKQRSIIVPLYGKDRAHDDRRKPAPAQHGIQKCAEGRARAVVKIFEVVQYGPLIYHPLPPARGVWMLGVYTRVVAEHELLIVQHEICVVGGEIHAHSVHAACQSVGVVAHIIYHCRNNDEENDAERAVFEKSLQLEIAYPMDKPDHRKPRPGVEAGPFARGTYSEEKPRQRKIALSAVRYVQVHKQVHKQNEEHGVAVDGRYPCLSKVHEVTGEDRRRAGADARR